MIKETYHVKVWESKELRGLTGDNGEQFIVFISPSRRFLDSAWKWFHVKAEAEKFAGEIKEKINEGCTSKN